MKKKPVVAKGGDESDASDAVDEPEEVSDDEGAAKRRSSGRLRGAKKPRLAEPESDEEDEENDDDEEEPDDDDDEENEDEEESNADSEEEYKTDQVKRRKKQNGRSIRKRQPRSLDNSEDGDLNELVAKEFGSGAYVVLKTDFANGGNPPIWKIDGKALLQKYIPFEQDGKTLYKNTSTYSGWSTGNKDNYHPAPIVYKTQNRKETIVEFLRDSIKIDAAVAPAATTVSADDDDPSATEQ